MTFHFFRATVTHYRHRQGQVPARLSGHMLTVKVTMCYEASGTRASGMIYLFFAESNPITKYGVRARLYYFQLKPFDI